MSPSPLPPTGGNKLNIYHDDTSLPTDVNADADANTAQPSLKDSAKSDHEYLHPSPYLGGQQIPHRAPSLDTLSNLSIDEINGRRRLSRSPVLTGVLVGPRHSPRRSLWGRAKSGLNAFWVKNKGVALVICSQIFGTLMNVTTRLLEVEGNNGKGLHPFQILFARMSITACLSTAFMWYKKTEHFPFGKREVRPLLIARGLGGFFGVFGMYYSLLYLPLADATVITFLAPSLACWACSYLINEPFTRMEQIAAYISLAGVVLIARPASLFAAFSASAPPATGNGDTELGTNNTTTAPSANDYENVTPAQRAGAVGIGMVGVLGAACAYTTIRWIGKRAHPLISVNYFAVWCTIVSTVMMFALPGVGFLLPAGLKEWGYLFFLGICGFVMQFLLAAGLQYEKSSRATNMTYTQMLFALTFDKIVFGHTPDALSIVGTSLILGSAIYVAVQKNAQTAGSTQTRARYEEERGLVEGIDDGEDEIERAPLQEIQLRTMRV